MKRLATFALGLALLAACGGAQTFGLTADDNNRDALGKALAMRTVPDKAGARNATGKPMVFAVVSGQPRKLVAYDLSAGNAVWTVDADVQSRVVVGSDFIVEREGQELVARELTSGKVRWKHGLSGDLMGADADAERAYFVVANTTGPKPVWTLAALDGHSGSQLWSADSPGQLGAPAAQGGLVLSPFLKQWLSVIDARTGAQITRIRGIDEEISFVRTTSDATWFGSTEGVFRLDERAATGSRADASYGTTQLPKQLAKATWGPDGFDTVQAGYSAADRTRILWRAPASGGDGPLAFEDGGVVVHYFRFLFGYTGKGELRWAYSHPRVELVASAHLGVVIGAVSGNGDVIAVDPTTGALKYQGSLGVSGSILGATFDADGWAPNDEVAAGTGGTVEALVAIARDRDARFADVKELAVSALATMPGREVSTELLAMIQDERTPAKLRDTAVEVLVQRRDVSALDAYAAALSVSDDFIAGTRPVAVGEVARVIAGLPGKDLDEAARQAAIDGLVMQLEAPGTENKDLIDIVRALGVIGNGAERAPLRRQLLAYRADSMFGSDDKLVKVVIDTLLAHGGAQERATLGFIADDPRSQPGVSAYAKAALKN